MTPIDTSGARAGSESTASRRVTVLIVTHDSASDLPACLDAVVAQDHRPLDLVVVDCSSRDRSVEIARTAELGDLERRVRALGENRGFSGGMNAGLAITDAPWVLALNADALPRPSFVSRLLERIEHHPRAAAITGRLVRPAGEDGIARLDACGMHLLPSWRHLDRGSGEPDRGQHEHAEWVFGATGAATLYRRAALDDVAFPASLGSTEPAAATGPNEIFDSLFHSYREDAELCFRFQARGWGVLYEPAAVAEHRRRVVPANRRQVPAAINRHSLKNRYLLRAYHQTRKNALRTAVATLLRDAMALSYVLLRERRSFPAYTWLWRHRQEIGRRRRFVQERRTEPEATLDYWFHHSARPLGPRSPEPRSPEPRSPEPRSPEPRSPEPRASEQGRSVRNNSEPIAGDRA